MALVLTRRAKLMLPLCMAGLLALSFYRLRPDRSEALVIEGKTMGTTYSVSLGAKSDPPDNLPRLIQTELDRIEALMSTYRPESEVSRFNTHDSSEPFHLSSDTLAVVEAANAVSRASDGAFDITVRPLVSLWGFGAGAQVVAPSEAKIASARQRIGYERLTLQPEKLSKSVGSLEIDLSAIAKGYAVDEVAALLSDHSIVHFLVEIGGELRVAGEKAPEVAWRLGIEQPSEQGRVVERVLELQDIGLATSGDYRNFYERDGVRISHTIDPRSGRPITHRLASVTVLHPQAMFADAWATALSVLGPEEGFQLAEREGLAALFLVRTATSSFQSQQTRRFSEITSPTQLE